MPDFVQLLNFEKAASILGATPADVRVLVVEERTLPALYATQVGHKERFHYQLLRVDDSGRAFDMTAGGMESTICAMLTDLSFPALEVWRLYRGRAGCENRIKELKADFGMGSFVLRDFWATEATLGVTMLSYNLMSVFRHAVMRKKVHHTLSTLHHQVLAVGALWDDSTKNTKQTFRLAVARKRRPWFEGLWANAGIP